MNCLTFGRSFEYQSDLARHLGVRDVNDEGGDAPESERMTEKRVGWRGGGVRYARRGSHGHFQAPGSLSTPRQRRM